MKSEVLKEGKGRKGKWGAVSLWNKNNFKIYIIEKDVFGFKLFKAFDQESNCTIYMS